MQQKTKKIKKQYLEQHVVNPELNFLERLTCAPSGGRFVHISLQNPPQLIVNPWEAPHNRCHHLSPPFLPTLKPNPSPKFYTIPKPRLISINRKKTKINTKHLRTSYMKGCAFCNCFICCKCLSKCTTVYKVAPVELRVCGFQSHVEFMILLPSFPN